MREILAGAWQILAAYLYSPEALVFRKGGPSHLLLVPGSESIKDSVGGHPGEVRWTVTPSAACNAGDPGLIPGSGRSAGEGIGPEIPAFPGEEN